MSTVAHHEITLPDAPAGLQARVDAGGAIAWSEPVTISTYEPDAPSRYPMYLDQRVYQGSSGRVYPLPFIEGIAAEPEPRTWQAIHLENRYLRLMVLPEIGGRLHIAFDKSTSYDFFYRNNVIKPALVGLTGPWVSGGLELNWPQHHRPATYLPVETTVEEATDGSVTVWCHDHDPFARMSGTHGFRLHPGRSVVELVVRLHNRTSLRESFLWWANAAVRVHDEYQSFFPRDVRYVADHARRAISAFPQADRPYYGFDYPAAAAQHPGADRLDYYKNIRVPTSYMVVDSNEHFFGGYDHAAGAGFVHWADRRISPGKKQWTWGNAPFGHAWDDHLTDGDGPYVELMAGVYTENQPDFAWLRPGETKAFSQYWYPIPAIGIAHAATPDAAMHLSVDGDGAESAIAATRPIAGAVVRFSRDHALLSEHRVDLEPGVPTRVRAVFTGGDSGLVVTVTDDHGLVMVEWRGVDAHDEAPWVATEPPAPDEIANVDELFLIGLHLRQYRHPTRSPMPYWREALRRDPSDSRVNLALAEEAFRCGDYEEALRLCRRAVARVTSRNLNPIDGEPYYLLGLILARLGRHTLARAAFGRAAWDSAWAAPSGLEAARRDAATGRNREAATDLAQLDDLHGPDPRRTALRAVLARRLGEIAGADALLRAGLRRTPLDVLLRYLAHGVVPGDPGAATDLALDLASIGETATSVDLLERVASSDATSAGRRGSTGLYLRALVLSHAGQVDAASATRLRARVADSTWDFPSGLDAHDALLGALQEDPNDATAASLLGALLYDAGRRETALKLWEHAVALGSTDPVTHRNAGLAAWNVAGDAERAWAHYAAARELDPFDARLLFEYDQLALQLHRSNSERLAVLEGEPDLVRSRDDLVVALADLLTAEHRADEALTLMESRSFHPWEGGEGSVLGAWDSARRALGLPEGAPPASLGEGRPVVTTPAARRFDGRTDYFATSLPETLLFTRTQP